jgi:hypothetical protein
VYGTELLTPIAAVPEVNVPVVVAFEQSSDTMEPVNVTDLVNVHDWPPRLIAKLAVPDVFGVPDIVYDTVPEPLLKVPAFIDAVNPVTPVELMF